MPYHEGMGGRTRFGTRAVSALLLAGLATGVATGVLVAPGPNATAAPSATVRALPRSALVSHAGVVAAHGHPPLPTLSVGLSGAPSLSLGATAPKVVGSVSVPTTEAQVAVDLIAVVDTRSGGQYAIAATAGNVTVLEKWMDNEGGLWADNPLNTSLDAARYPHQFTTGGVDTGIPIFPDISTGIDATAVTLLSNRAYAPILRVLASGTGSCVAFARAVIGSPWAASHYGGDPARFCGAPGGPSTIVAATTACLRLPGHSGRASHRSARMPGACGRRAAATRDAAPGHFGHRRPGSVTSPGSRHPHGARHLGSRASAVRRSPLGQPARRAGGVRHRRR